MRKLLFTAFLVFALLIAMPGNSFASNDNQADDNKRVVKTYVYKKVINLSNGDVQKHNLESWLQDILKNNIATWKFNKTYKYHWHSDRTPKHEKDQSEKSKQPEPEQEEPKQEQPQQPEEDPKREQPEPEQQPAPAPQPPKEEPVKEEKPNEEAGYQLNEFEQQVVTLTNQERAKAGLPELKVDLELSKVARIKSQDMKNSGYFSHDSPKYGSPFDMMRNFGIQYRAAGENIAMGQRTPQQVVNAWMNSDGHRRNIMNPQFTHIGVGYVADGNYWTQQFISK